MLCTFCGTENRPENKFCGMCGVRMDRRQAERRGLQSSAVLRCPSCSHVNEAGHKFCGMCGARTDRRTLTDRRPIAGGATRATAIANAQLPTPDTPPLRAETPPSSRGPLAVATAPASEEEALPHTRNNVSIFREEHASAQPAAAPRVSGPSFLGLGDESQGDSRYLLEDEGSSGGVLRTLVLIAILAAIGGLIFVAWRSGTFRLPTKSPEKPPAGEPVSAPSPRGAGQNATPEASPSPANTSTVTDQTPTDTPSSASTGDPGAPKQLQPVAEKPGSTKKTDVKANEDEIDSTPAKSRSSAPAAVARKPSAALLRAQQYLQGRGVRQNCEQGLLYLRAATQQNDPAAAVQMGALYASGHCVTQDRVMAYRWFNSAHELDPGNQWIQADLEQLWARMTPQERHKAGP
jgi:Double zinc ribbon